MDWTILERSPIAWDDTPIYIWGVAWNGLYTLDATWAAFPLYASEIEKKIWTDYHIDRNIMKRSIQIVIDNTKVIPMNKNAPLKNAYHGGTSLFIAVWDTLNNQPISPLSSPCSNKEGHLGRFNTANGGSWKSFYNFALPYCLNRFFWQTYWRKRISLIPTA